MKKILRAIRNRIFVLFYYFFRFFPVQKNKIFIQNFNGKGYGDNPKYIVEEICRHNLDFVIVWAVKLNSNLGFPSAVKRVKYKSIKSIYEEATAKIWIDNCRKQPYVRKRKNQFYIQTWHDGCIPLKKMEKDVEETLDPYYLHHAKQDSKLIDLLLSNSEFYTKIYRSGFWYNGEIMKCGSPRDDLFFKKEKNTKDKVLSCFSIAKDANIVLYAPTFRDTFDTDVIAIDYQSIRNLLLEKTGRHWVFLVRLHPNISEKSGFIEYTDSIINATNYDDMQELLSVSDILISDYSGVMFEFALMKKPVFIYAKDCESYNRNFYVDLFSLPFPVAKNMQTLIDNISQFDLQTYSNKLELFFHNFGIFEDGKASERVVDKICSIINSPS